MPGGCLCRRGAGCPSASRRWPPRSPRTRGRPRDPRRGKQAMSHLLAALYARVSSEQQAQAQTIASQLAALRERIAADGLTLPAEREFIDAGYSGATLVRPALERLRDLVATDGIDRLYLLAPD